MKHSRRRLLGLSVSALIMALAVLTAPAAASAQTTDDEAAPEILGVVEQHAPNSVTIAVQAHPNRVPQIFVNGEPGRYPFVHRERRDANDVVSVRMWGLDPGERYEVRARYVINRHYGEFGPWSDVFELSVPASGDHEPPTTPDFETFEFTFTGTLLPLGVLEWEASTDNVDSSSELFYFIQYENEDVRPFRFSGTSIELMLPDLLHPPHQPSVHTIWAVDSSNNESEKVTFQLSLPGDGTIRLDRVG